MSLNISQFKVNDTSAYLTGVDISLDTNKDTQQPASCKSVNEKFTKLESELDLESGTTLIDELLVLSSSLQTSDIEDKLNGYKEFVIVTYNTTSDYRILYTLDGEYKALLGIKPNTPFEVNLPIESEIVKLLAENSGETSVSVKIYTIGRIGECEKDIEELNDNLNGVEVEISKLSGTTLIDESLTLSSLQTKSIEDKLNGYTEFVIVTYNTTSDYRILYTLDGEYKAIMGIKPNIPFEVNLPIGYETVKLQAENSGETSVSVNAYTIGRIGECEKDIEELNDNLSELYLKELLNQALSVSANQTIDIAQTINYTKEFQITTSNTTSDYRIIYRSNGEYKAIMGIKPNTKCSIAIPTDYDILKLQAENSGETSVHVVIEIDGVVSKIENENKRQNEILNQLTGNVTLYEGDININDGFSADIVDLFTSKHFTLLYTGTDRKLRLLGAVDNQYEAIELDMRQNVEIPINIYKDYDTIKLMDESGERGTFSINLCLKKYGIIESVNNEILDIKSALPSYYFPYIDDKIQEIKEYLDTLSSDSHAFFFITDTHYMPIDRPAQLNRYKSVKMMKYISDRLPIDTIIHGGDLYEGILYHYPILDFVNALPSSKFFLALGNHEYTSRASMDKVSWYTTKYDSGMVYGDKYKTYGYYDDKSNKVRYITLSSYTTYNPNIGYDNNYRNDEQYNWFVETLNSCPIGYIMVIATHTMYTLDASGNNLTLESFNGATQRYVDAIEDYNGQGEIACVLIGHTHRDRLHKNNKVPYILSQSDRWASITDQGYADINVNRDSFTTNEQHFEVVTIDRTNRIIKLFAIGSNSRNGVGNEIGEECTIRETTY